MIDTEPVMLTEDSDQLIPVRSTTSINNNQMQLPSEILTGPGMSYKPSAESLTPENMLIFERYLPKKEFNELACVFRVLNPDPSKGNITMLHTLILNNHPHLLK